MPRVPIIMPQLGEAIAEATVVRFCVEVGEQVEADQEILEVETNKAVMGVTTPCSGLLESFSAEATGTYPIGTVLGYVAATEEEAEKLGENQSTPLLSEAPLSASPLPEAESENMIPSLPVPVKTIGANFISPRLRARLEELNLHSSEIGVVPGTGRGGRVTLRDFEDYLEEIAAAPIEKASQMRLAVADSMRRSWTRPLATLGVSISMEPIMAHRKKVPAAPGPALYLAKALALALRERPHFAARLVGDKVILPVSIDIGIAVALEDGIIVPVIRDLDRKPLIELGKDYADLLAAARARRLPYDAREGSIASVTNFGPLGITWATPIPLPSETLIAGLGRAEKRPVWDEAKECFLPQIQAELDITFDHRVIDGLVAGKLSQRLTELLQTPDAL